MKLTFITIIALCLLLALTSNKPVEIDFNPKRLKTEIERQFKQPEYHKQEIKADEPGFINGKFFSLNHHQLIFGYLYIGRVNSCRANGCSFSGTFNRDDTSEYFDYFILFHPDRTVAGVFVFNYAATHGQEITSKGWLKQFIGYDGHKDLSVGKNIDAISGATISVFGITEDIRQKTLLLESITI